MKTLAIYPGSFNPFHQGHQNILEKAERIFGKDNVIIAIGINSEKYSKLEDAEFREMINLKIQIIEQQLPSKKIEYYMGFLTDYVREKEEEEECSVVVIRGLRNGSDFDYEYTSSRFCWDQMPELKFIYIPCDPIFTHVSSSAYRALEKVQPGAGHKYLAREVEDTSKVIL